MPINSVTGILFLKYTWLYFHFSAVLFPFLKPFCYFLPRKEEGERKSLSGLSRLTGSGSGMLKRSPFFMSPDPQGPFRQVEWKKLGKGSRLMVLSRAGESDRAAVWEGEKDFLHAWRERRRNRLGQSTSKSQKTIFVCLFCWSQRLFSSRQAAQCQDPWFGEHNTDWILGPIAQLNTESLCPGITSQGLHILAQYLESDFDFSGHWRRWGMLRDVVEG